MGGMGVVSDMPTQEMIGRPVCIAGVETVGLVLGRRPGPVSASTFAVGSLDQTTFLCDNSRWRTVLQYFTESQMSLSQAARQPMAP